MPKIVTTVEYEAGDIYNMPFERQKELILVHVPERAIRAATKDLFPLTILLEKADRAIMFHDNFQL